MKITCSVSDHAYIGYVYLQRLETKYIENEYNNLLTSEAAIPVIKDDSRGLFLSELEIYPHSIRKGYKEKHFHTEYGVDFDDQGYLIGFELGLSPHYFEELINNKAFKLIQTTWKNQQYHIFTLDHHEKVFTHTNVLCSMNGKSDAYMIVEFINPLDLNIHYYNSEDRKKKLAIFKALVSSNEHTYPLQYLSQPEFIIFEDNIEELTTE